MRRKLALRMDDVGASSKLFERYTKVRLLNVGFLRNRHFFGAWGPYRELEPSEWTRIFHILRQAGARLTVGITAAWVEWDGTLVPFPEKYPEELEVLRTGVEEGLIEIANHGLTHCVSEGGLFRYKFFGSNRKYHREFWQWVPERAHRNHLEHSQEILHRAFGSKVVTFIPPGNVYSQATLAGCQSVGLQILNCHDPKIVPEQQGSLRIIGNDNVLAFHDREIVLNGTNWLASLLSQNSGAEFCFVRDL